MASGLRMIKGILPHANRFPCKSRDVHAPTMPSAHLGKSAARSAPSPAAHMPEDIQVDRGRAAHSLTSELSELLMPIDFYQLSVKPLGERERSEGNKCKD